jgi:phosphate-selective porin OprO/OprP
MERISIRLTCGPIAATRVITALLCVIVLASATAGWAQEASPPPPPAPQAEASTSPAEAAGTVSLSPPQSTNPLHSNGPSAVASVQPLTGDLVSQQTPPGPSASPVDLERRVHELEAIVQQMQAQSGQVLPVPPAPDANATSQSALGAIGLQQPATAPPTTTTFNPIASEGVTNTPSPGSTPFGGWKNGFFLESADKSFILRITGQVQMDYREFLNTRDRTDMDTFLLRRARFGLEGTVFKYYEFRFLPDFGQGQVIVQDAYLNVHYLDAFQFEAGRFKQPFSYEQLIQDRYVPTLERSIIDQLVPERDLGAMLHGEEIFNNHLDYGVALSNGEINGNTVDPNNHKDFNGRVAIRPFNDPDASQWIRGIQVGTSGGFGIEQEAMTPATLRTPDTVPFLNFNSTVRADGLRWRLSPEFAYFNGPFGFLGQYYHEEQEMRPSATGAGYKFLTNVPFNGYVLLASLLLTGETRTTYSEPIDPLKPFDPHCPLSKPGAWELVGRVSRLDVGDVFNPGAAQLVNPAKNSNEAMEFTLGFNWYFNKWVRMQFNYEHDMFGQPVALGTTAANLLNSQDSLFTRFQVIF